MAYGKNAWRDAIAGEAGRRLGLNTLNPRIFQAQVLSAPAEAALASLPVDASNYAPIQDSSGNLYFMPDMDPVDSDLYIIQ
jgi:hypothetical protein